jgi:hypothetical protein
MPLINFKTNLTSLRFGMDQPGGGDSGQPFIQSPIETVNTPTDFKDLYQLNRTSLDFPIRGGAISSLVNGTYTTKAAIVDLERIKKFFKSAPQGTAFIQKQKGLQLTNPKTQVPNSLQFAGLSLDNAVIPVTQVYDPKNTLIQVGVQGTGAHYNRQGISPTLYEGVRTTYQYIAGAPENNRDTTNRLAILRALKLLQNTNFLVNPDVTYGTGIDPILMDRMGISPLQNQIFNYQGGPGSVYGDGFTRIFRTTNTDSTYLSITTPDPNFTANGQVTQPYSTIAFTYQQIADQKTRKNVSPVAATVQDFRAYLPAGTPWSDYERLNINTRIGVGYPGAPNARKNYSQYGTRVGEDKLNMQGPFYFNGKGGEDPWNLESYYTSDMIKFAFECIDNNNTTQDAALVFRAFLEGSISDTNQAEYSSFKYLGRGETFRTYQGFDRSISFSFKMYAQSRQELMPMYQKLNQLISQVYPDYSPSYNLMRGNVVKLTIGDYIYRMPGFLENVNVTIDNSNTPWEIVLKEYDDASVRQLPHMVTVQCSFKPIMDILPRKQDYANKFVPLIVNKDHFLDSTATNEITRAIPSANPAVIKSNSLAASNYLDTTSAASGLFYENYLNPQGRSDVVPEEQAAAFTGVPNFNIKINELVDPNANTTTKKKKKRS